MPPILENEERRKRRDPEMLVWDRVVRLGHWLLAFAFATLYLEYKKFPLHPYAGYLVFLVLIFRVIWGFIGSRAARFSSFSFSPREMIRYMKSAFSGHAEYHFSHNPMGAAMVYALIALLLLNCCLGMLTYSASQQLGPFGALVPAAWEDNLTAVHKVIGHLSAILVVSHLAGVVWAARLHRENYVLAMLNGVRRIPRAVPIPDGALRLLKRGDGRGRFNRLNNWLNYRHPVLGTLLLMIVIGALAVPLIDWLVQINKSLPAY